MVRNAVTSRTPRLEEECVLCESVGRTWPGETCYYHTNPVAASEAYALVPVSSLKELRESWGISVYHLSDLSGLDPNTIWSLESGERMARKSTALKLASALGVGLDELQDYRREED